MKKLNRLPLHIIASILYAIVTISCIVSFISSPMPGKAINTVGYAAITYGLFKNKRDWLVVSGFGFIVFTSLLSLIFSAVSFIQYYEHYNSFSMIFNLCSSAMSLLRPLSVFILAFVLLTDCAPKHKDKARKLWFVPGVLYLTINILGIAMSLIYTFANNSGSSMIPLNVVYITTNIVLMICTTVSVFMVCAWCAQKE